MRTRVQHRRETAAKYALMLGSVLLIALVLGGCGGPSDDQVAADLAKLHPGCALESASGGADTNGNMNPWPDEIWIDATVSCDGVTRTELLHYETTGDSTWQLVKPPSGPPDGERQDPTADTSRERTKESS